MIMTEHAVNFINPITFETLTGNKCIVDTFDRNFQHNVEHVSLGKRADVLLVAPATANVIGKMAAGIADDADHHLSGLPLPRPDRAGYEYGHVSEPDRAG